MKSSGESLSPTIQPVLDTFLNNAVALTGCHSYGFARESCEYDLLVVSDEEKPYTSMRVGDRYCDVSFMTGKEVMNPSNPELAVALSSMIPLRDSSWMLSTAASTNRAMFTANARRCGESRLSFALKELSRSEEALGRNSLADADFWLNSAGFDFAFATIYASETPPAPSHILKQMKTVSGKGEASFTEWAAAVGLGQSSREACLRRLEGLSTMYDVLSSTATEARSNRLIETRRADDAVKILRAKAEGLLDSLEQVDCFAFLGYEMVLTLDALLELQSMKESTEPDYASVVGALTKGRLGIISLEVVRELGLTRDEKTVSRTADLLREAISEQAKRL